MKRSIISLLFFTVTVLGVSAAEILYSNSVASYIDAAVEECRSAESSGSISESVKKLKKRYTKAESLNELFLSRDTTEKIEFEISDLEEYALHGDTLHINQCLNHLQLYAKDLYNGGLF